MGSGRGNRIEGRNEDETARIEEHLKGQYGNLVQWKLPIIYEDDHNEVSK